MKKIFISAGDPSGDEHASKIVKELMKASPTLHISGMGGSHLRAAGVHTSVDSERDASVMGTTDVVKALPKLLRTLKTLVNQIKREKPDLLLLVDYQEFNMLLAKRAKKLGIKTLFFIAPSIWAWRAGRVKNFIRYIDELAVIYPFEKEVFQMAGYKNVHYVGHPLMDEIEKYQVSDHQKNQLLEKFNIPKDSTRVALFPGSRTQEIKRHLLPMISAFADVKKEIPNLHALIPIPPSIQEDALRKTIAGEGLSDIHFLSDASLEVLNLCHAGLIKSGTSNLQAALAELPFSMVYKANFTSEVIVRLLFTRRVFSIVNIIQPDTVREIIQQDVNTTVLTKELKKLLQDTPYQHTIKEKLKDLKKLLLAAKNEQKEARSTCSKQVSDWVLSHL